VSGSPRLGAALTAPPAAAGWTAIAGTVADSPGLVTWTVTTAASPSQISAAYIGGVTSRVTGCIRVMLLTGADYFLLGLYKSGTGEYVAVGGRIDRIYTIYGVALAGSASATVLNTHVTGAPYELWVDIVSAAGTITPRWSLDGTNWVTGATVATAVAMPNGIDGCAMVGTDLATSAFLAQMSIISLVRT